MCNHSYGFRAHQNMRIREETTGLGGWPVQSPSAFDECVVHRNVRMSIGVKLGSIHYK